MKTIDIAALESVTGGGTVINMIGKPSNGFTKNHTIGQLRNMFGDDVEGVRTIRQLMREEDDVRVSRAFRARERDWPYSSFL